MTIVLWVRAGCDKCEKFREQLQMLGLSFTERDLNAVICATQAPTAEVIEAYATLMLNDGDFPVVQVGAKFFGCEEALEYIKKCI